MKAFRPYGSFTILLLVFLVSAFAACGFQPAKSESSRPAPTKEVDEFQVELTALKNADFDYIYSFMRKDGKPMDSKDKRFVKNNSHFATNRFTLSNDETVIFAGSNYKFNEHGLAALKDRFEVGDYSKPAQELENRRKEIIKLKEKDGKSDDSTESRKEKID